MIGNGDSFTPSMLHAIGSHYWLLCRRSQSTGACSSYDPALDTSLCLPTGLSATFILASDTERLRLIAEAAHIPLRVQGLASLLKQSLHLRNIYGDSYPDDFRPVLGVRISRPP